MISVEIEYKEKIDIMGVYNFIRIIKYKHHSWMFKRKIKTTITNTFTLGKSEYIDMTNNIIKNGEKKEYIKAIVLNDIKKRGLKDASRKQSIKRGAWNMEFKLEEAVNE